jgi:hypothetical protein
MTRSPSIQLKAAFLLIVFSLNTAVGFACSVGFDIKFTGSHHGKEKVSITHKHTEPHHREEKTIAAHKHDNSHQHDGAITDDHQSEKTKDDCCTDEAIKFAQIDKRAPQSFDFSFHPVFFALFLTSIYNFDVFSDKLIAHRKYFVRGNHPPIPEIRIAIRSFQI